METLEGKKILISGASFAGLSTAYWMNKLGCKVTIIEISGELRKGGTPVNIGSNTVDIVKRMGIFEQIRSNRINMTTMEFKNLHDVTEGSMSLKGPEDQNRDDEFEIERDILLDILFKSVKNDVEVIFSDSITALSETDDNIQVTFDSGVKQGYDLVFGCDGLHSTVRKLWFGHEAEYMHFLKAYFSITIVNKSLIKSNTSQMHNVPGKAVMLSSYNNKTDIVLCFFSEKEISYDYRNEEQQRMIILDRFSEEGWRTAELLEEIRHSATFYFDKLCQIKMPFWTKGRVALVGDAGYCASPAAGMGGSLAILGAAALYDAFQIHHGNFQGAFQEYNQNLRPYIEQIQEGAVKFGVEMLVPKTEEAIQERYRQSRSL